MKKMTGFLLGMLAIFLPFGCDSDRDNQNANKKPNIVFISVDDLRPMLGCYGDEVIQTPYLDQLAAGGHLFERAYCQVPVCGASRASILTGLRPTSKRFLNYATRIDQDASGVTTLPQHFKNHGYYTLNLGKVGHWPDDRPESWSEEPVRLDWHKLPDGSWSYEGWRDYQMAFNLAVAKAHPKGAGPPYERGEVHDTAYVDGKNMQLAIDRLKDLKEKRAPFFLALGILKPHLPFNAPAKYWDLYDTSDIRLATNPTPPVDVPVLGMNNFGELRAYARVPSKGPIPDSLARKLVHGYYASVSYVDALIGDLMQALEELELIENTIIVVWGDHGWFLGEHGFWCKHALYELANRVPLIIKRPGQLGGKINSFVELLDLYPTLCEMVGLPAPAHLQGKSFINAFADPYYEHRPFAYSRYRQGESIKNASGRYTAYFDPDGALISDMYYDHLKDPDENINMASIGEYEKVINELQKDIDHLKAGN